MVFIETLNPQCWVIGYGNSQRRDDGLGQYVASLVDKSLKNRDRIKIMAIHQLDPALIEEMHHAGRVIFVDATMEILESGLRWVKLEPDFRAFYHVTHLFYPSSLLALIQSVYQKTPEAWLVTVQGDNFEFGDMLTPEAGKRGLKAASEIISFLIRHHY